MLYKSTRGGQSGLSFEDVLLSAYARDGGLFVPECVPRLTTEQLRRWGRERAPLWEVCAGILVLFTDLALHEAQEMCKRAFATFNDGQAPALPLRRVGGLVLLDTGMGPTLAFKDIGQQVVAQLLNHYLGKRGRTANIVVETSGDTGPAAVAAVSGCPHVRIFCLYPSGRTSTVQELQMITADAPNVHIFRTEGDTDEQAEALKLLFMDADFMRENRVCSINSINWARILAQSTYYAWAYAQLCPEGETALSFAVPTGAFGNAMGGLLARTMGVPIERILCATNANDIVHRTISRGDMSMGKNHETCSPAMDIQFAYNMERMLYYVMGEDAECTRSYMAALEADRRCQLPPEALRRVQQVFHSVSVDDAATLGTMKRVWDESGYCLDPHSAVGVYAAGVASDDSRLRAGETVCVLTAHPAKFQDTVVRAGIPLEACKQDHVEALKALPTKFTWLRAPAGQHTPLEKRVSWAAEVRAAVEGREA